MSDVCMILLRTHRIKTTQQMAARLLLRAHSWRLAQPVKWLLSTPTGTFEENKWTHCTRRAQYLLVTKGLGALDFALPVVLHDHHGGIDFSHCEVCRCWESDKLTCKIRPFLEWTLSARNGRKGVWGMQTRQKNQTGTRSKQSFHRQIFVSRGQQSKATIVKCH